MADNIDIEEIQHRVEQSDQDPREAAREVAAERAQYMMTEWLDGVRHTITARQGGSWPNSTEAQDGAEAVEGTPNEEDAIEDALLDVQKRIVRVMFKILEVRQDPTATHQDVKDAFEHLLVELHNPSTQEAILLAIQPEYREDLRTIFDDLGSNLWGLYEVLAGVDGEERWAFIETLAAANGVTVEEAVRNAPDINTAEIPQNYRDE
jgi:hypothetical protein